MFFPLLATRVLARNVVSSTRVALRIPVTTTQITRPFSVSSVAWASTEAATKAKTTAKKPTAKKSSASQSAKKPARKTTKKKSAAKPKAKKKVAKKPAVIRVGFGQKPPRRPGTAFTIFYTEFFARKQAPSHITGIQYGQDTTKEAAAAWHNLSEQEKQSYRDQATRAAEEYRKKIEEYGKNTDPAIIKEVNRRLVKAGKRKLAIKTRTSYNGFILYVNDERKNRPKSTSLADSQNELREFSKTWNALSEQEKAAYSARALDMNRQTAQT